MAKAKEFESEAAIEMVVDLRVGDERFRGRLLETGMSDAVVEFPTPGGPSLPMGNKYPLSFLTASLDKPLPAMGRVVRRLESEDTERYHFHLANASSTAVRTLFNRRGALRIWSDPEQPVRVVVRTAGNANSLHGEMKDISVTGIGLRVPEDVEAGMVNTHTCQLAFALEGGPALELSAQIRHRALSAAGVVYGLEFDRACPGYEASSEVIMKWVRQREIGIIRRARESAEE